MGSIDTLKPLKQEGKPGVIRTSETQRNAAGIKHSEQWGIPEATVDQPENTGGYWSHCDGQSAKCPLLILLLIPGPQELSTYSYIRGSVRQKETFM
jgi:hypothetical protein